MDIFLKSIWFYLIGTNILDIRYWPEDLVWGLSDELTFQSSSMAQLQACFCPALSSTNALPIFISGCLFIHKASMEWPVDGRHQHCYYRALYIHVCLCVYRYLGHGAHQCACLCMSACVHAFESCFHLVPRSSLLMRLSVEIIGRLSPQVQPWHCLVKNQNPVSRNVTATF